MHAILERQLQRAGLDAGALPRDCAAWAAFLHAVERAYGQADDDRYLLERSLALSSEEMGELHAQLAAERDTISTVICALAEGVCAVDQRGTILFVNPEAVRLLRLTEAESIVGRPLCELVRARSEQGAAMHALLLGGAREPRQPEFRLIIADDEATHIACTIAALGQSNDGLVITLRDVTERRRLDAERAELHGRLLEASRSAGMAEVASGVLHNVGNVLNSVNVSATLASDRIEGSKAAALRKLADLLTANQPRLAEFLTSDPAGRRVPEYIARLAEACEHERREVIDELAQVRKNIDHIREIVSTQQTYAKGGAACVKSPEHIASLVEDALRVTASALVRQQVEVVRDFQPLPPVKLELHGVLQILINLITNATQALAHNPPGQRRIAIRIARTGGGALIRVADNGMGIPAENLARVFQHGFTTRENGHGFGLHSAALAARAMGASIRAESDGPGCGAAFTLELPIDPDEVPADNGAAGGQRPTMRPVSAALS